MNVLNKYLQLNSLRDVQILLLGITVSLLFLGYAFSSITLSLFIIYTIIIFFLKKSKFHIRRILLLPILLYLYLALTYFWTVDHELTKIGLTRIISLALIPFTFFFIPSFSIKELRYILKIFTISNLVFASFFLINSALRYIQTNNIDEFTYHNLVQDFELNAVYVSAYFSLSFYYLITVKNKTTTLWLLALFLLFNIFLLSSKTILFVVFITGAIYIIKSLDLIKRTIKKRGTIIITIILIGSFISIPIINRIVEEGSSNLEEVLQKEKFNKVYPWTGSSFRVLQLRILKEQIKEEKILFKGFGLFASRDSLKNKHIELNTYPGYHTYNYHNMYAQILSESGIIGLLMLLLLIVNFLIAGVKSKSLCFMFFGVLIFTWFISESVLWVHRGILFFTIFYCLFVSTNYSTHKLKGN